MRFDNLAIGITIKRLRLERNLSQDVLSGFANIARSHLSMIENGAKQPNLETLWKIAFALGIKPSELVAIIEKEMISAQQASELPPNIL